MEVHFSPEQEARISQIASYNGTPAEQLVKQAALRLVGGDAEIRASIRLGIEQPDRGQLIDHEDVKARLYRRQQAK